MKPPAWRRPFHSHEGTPAAAPPAEKGELCSFYKLGGFATLRFIITTLLAGAKIQKSYLGTKVITTVFF